LENACGASHSPTASAAGWIYRINCTDFEGISPRLCVALIDRDDRSPLTTPVCGKETMTGDHHDFISRFDHPETAIVTRSKPGRAIRG
jgi:hypothetical protein